MRQQSAQKNKCFITVSFLGWLLISFHLLYSFIHMSVSPCINTLFFHNHLTPQWLSRTQLIPVARTFPFPHYHLLVNHSHEVPFVKKMTESILPCCKLDLISVANLQSPIMWPNVCCSTGIIDPLSKSLWPKVSQTFNNLRSSEALSTASGRLWALSLSRQDLHDLHHRPCPSGPFRALRGIEVALETNLHGQFSDFVTIPAFGDFRGQ